MDYKYQNFYWSIKKCITNIRISTGPEKNALQISEFLLVLFKNFSLLSYSCLAVEYSCPDI